MEDKKFVTQTAPKSSIFYLTAVSVLFAVIFVASYYLFSQIRSYIPLIGVLVCISCLGAGIILASSPPVTLCFKNNELFITDSNGKQYNIYAVPSSDFVFMQTPLEKKLNIGCLRIKHTSFWMVGVKNIAETKEYIQINFPNWE